MLMAAAVGMATITWTHRSRVLGDTAAVLHLRQVARSSCWSTEWSEHTKECSHQMKDSDSSRAMHVAEPSLPHPCFRIKIFTAQEQHLYCSLLLLTYALDWFIQCVHKLLIIDSCITHLLGHLQVCLLVHVRMADAVRVAQHGDACVALDVGHERVAATAGHNMDQSSVQTANFRHFKTRETPQGECCCHCGAQHERNAIT